MAVTTNVEDINSFLARLKTGHVFLIDARSPKEFLHAHIPGAFNLPLLNDEERHEVGITYKESGHHEAVRKGFELVGHKFKEFIDVARQEADSREILMYCWRGGIRSGTMAWILEMAGFRVTLLSGGYKSFRNWVLRELEEKRNVVVLSGKTGTGKTTLLARLAARGECVIDLEGFACHKGSTFGALGQLPQPSAEQFENQLALAWHASADSKWIWMEDESRWIGSIKIPDAVYERMRNCPVVEMQRDRQVRVQHILNEYGHFPTEILAERTSMLSKRMGGDRVKLAIECLQSGDMNGWVTLLLDYYDKAYSFGLSKRKPGDIIPLSLGSSGDDQVTEVLLRLNETLHGKWQQISTNDILP